MSGYYDLRNIILRFIDRLHSELLFVYLQWFYIIEFKFDTSISDSLDTKCTTDRYPNPLPTFLFCFSWLLKKYCRYIFCFWPPKVQVLTRLTFSLEKILKLNIQAFCWLLQNTMRPKKKKPIFKINTFFT